jgi:hypothetical protein
MVPKDLLCGHVADRFLNGALLSTGIDPGCPPKLAGFFRPPGKHFLPANLQSSFTRGGVSISRPRRQAIQDSPQNDINTRFSFLVCRR